MTEADFIKLTLSPTEQENWRTVRRQKILYRVWCEKWKREA